MSEPVELFDANRGAWAIADPELKAEVEELTGEAYRTRGLSPTHGQPLAAWLDELERADVILRAALGWHRDLATVKAIKAAEARGVIVFYPDAPDPLAA